MKATYHSRRNFYNGAPVYWYSHQPYEMLLKPPFLLVPGTSFYEFGGSHEEAIKALKSAGFDDIVEGNEL